MNIVILSTRISGNDGVSLECHHWKKMLVEMGHKVTFIAGKLDVSGYLIPELHFQWPAVMEVHDTVVCGKGSYKDIEDKVFDIAGTIEGKLRRLLRNGKKTDLLVVMNVFSLPMNFPLAVAVSRVSEEMDIPVIARHNDFWWERERYLKSRLFPFFERWFPPKTGKIAHVVINSKSQAELKKRMGIDSVIIPDSFDFSNEKIKKRDSFSKSFKKNFGIKEDEIVFLQATRIIPRKRVELSIELIKKLNFPKYSFVIAGQWGDEGSEYQENLIELAKSLNVNCKFIGDDIDIKRGLVKAEYGGKFTKKRIYTLWDAYVNSDVVLYPTKIEGFGNQFIEAVYFKKPVILTPYPVFKADIAPLGFETINMTSGISDRQVKRIKNEILNTKKIGKMVAKNFDLGKKYFSYEATSGKIRDVISSVSPSF